MKKQILSLVLAAVFVFSSIPAVSAFAGTAWDGTEKAEPTITDGIYQIQNGAELAWLAEETKTNGSVNAVLTNDIDLGNQEWSPIGQPASGYVTEAFSGTFDGQGHTISGLSIHTDKTFYGLFWCVYGGTIKNLNVIGNVSTSGNTAGGIVGKLQFGTVENCSFDGSVTVNGRDNAGGIVGTIQGDRKNASVITSCCNKGEISGPYAGGILGRTTAAKTNTVIISHCYNTGTINGKTRSAGISGQQQYGEISYCYNIASSASGICGFSNAAITNCYYLYDETVTPGGSAAGYAKITDKASLLESLNAGESKLFTADTRNKNNGYPVLFWQNRLTPEEEAAEQKKREDAERVRKAVGELSLDTSPVKEACILKLPSALNECAVSWSSSNPDIIGNDGRVTLPDKNITAVTLTATVTCGESSESKDFSINVWSKSIDAEVYLQAVLDAMKWNFALLQPVYGQDGNMLVKFQSVLKDKGFDGITVTIRTTADESLVAKTGKIFYPEIDENKYSGGRQVQVLFTLSLDGKSVTYPQNGESLLIPWNTDSVSKALESTAATALSESVIADKNTSLDFVSSDLYLPSNINRGNGKYAFAWVTWQSSDNTHLSVSDEKRQGSVDDMTYGAYVGKVHRDSKEHTVTLTAAITNPSTEVTIEKSFTVTVAPLSSEELTQTLDKMTAVLNCYTADKLTDSATKKQLDINAVDNDIQLVIPKNVVTADELAALNYGRYWDYWNYKFSVSSSDTDVIEINAFRAFVYRPLGENSSADRKVTLTVKMESKENPNLFVTRDITVTVRHLSRADILAQLDLMDRAKENYANGLLGNNTDAYSIIDNLSPYLEIVWNGDKSDVEFIRRQADLKENGIRVDTLPNWEEQEDWRLFKTSNKDLISNETLILNKTPNESTFVKINSVLTDESLGKYYNKFKNVKGFDAEALAKFRQLYKQPVSAYVMVVGANDYTDTFALMSPALKASVFSNGLSAFKKELDKPISVTFSLLGLDGAAMISKTTDGSFTKGATVFDVFKKQIADNNMYYSANGSYVSSVNGLAEKAYGGNSGWMYSVDGVFVNSYMNAQELSGGEDIIVMYVRDYRNVNKTPDDNPNGDENNNQGNSGDNNNNNNSGGNTKPNGNHAKPDESNSNGNAKPNNSPSGNTDTQNGTSGGTNAPSGDNASASNGKTDGSAPSEPADKTDPDSPAEDAGNSGEGSVNTANDSGNAQDTSSVKDSSTGKESNTINPKIIIPSVIAALLGILIIILLIVRKRRNK